MGRSLDFETIFKDNQQIRDALNDLRNNKEINCSDFKLKNNIHCYLRTKIDPLGKEIGFLIILRVVNE